MSSVNPWIIKIEDVCFSLERDDSSFSGDWASVVDSEGNRDLTDDLANGFDTADDWPNGLP